MSPYLEILLTAVTTLGAAFLGAGYAFRLNDNAHARQTTRDRVAAVNRAIFVLIRQLNTLKLVQRQVIDDKRNDPVRFINMRPLPTVSSESPKLNLHELSFLLETGDRNLLLELLLEEERYRAAVGAIDERSRLHLEVLQPRLAAAGISEKAKYEQEKIVKILGEPFCTQLRRATDNAIRHVDTAIASNREFVDRFHVAMKQRYPNQSILMLELGSPLKAHLEDSA